MTLIKQILNVPSQSKDFRLAIFLLILNIETYIVDQFSLEYNLRFDPNQKSSKDSNFIYKSFNLSVKYV